MIPKSINSTKTGEVLVQHNHKEAAVCRQNRQAAALLNCYDLFLCQAALLGTCLAVEYQQD